MKVTLWMSTSANGMIARDNRDEDFISHASYLEWLKVIRKTGNVILGRNSYENLLTWPKLSIDEVKSVFAVIVSSKKSYITVNGFHFAKSPKEALQILENEGFTNVTLSGGSILNSSFASEGLIDEIVLNIEASIVGRGIPIFKNKLFDYKLRLISLKKSAFKTIQIQYSVIK